MTAPASCRLVLAIIAVVASAAWPGDLRSAAQTLPAEISRMRVSAERATVREKPSADAPAVTELSQGQEVQVVERSGAWMLIRVPGSGREGFVHGLLLDAIPAVAPTEPPGTLQMSVLLVDDQLTVRPVPRHVVLLTPVAGGTPPIRVVAGFDGRAEAAVPAGAYTLASERAIDFQGRSYRWVLPVTIAAGQRAVLDLSVDNASPPPVSRTALPSVVAAPGPPPNPGPVAAGANLLGLWEGTYAGSPAELRVTEQAGERFVATLMVTTQAGRARSEISVTGRLSPGTLELTETVLVTRGAARAWSLGRGSGTLAPDGRSMRGTGRDGQSDYTWTFARRGDVAAPPVSADRAAVPAARSAAVPAAPAPVVTPSLAPPSLTPVLPPPVERAPAPAASAATPAPPVAPLPIRTPRSVSASGAAVTSPVEIGVGFVRDTFSANGRPLPSWRVELEYRNRGAQPVRLGPTLSLIGLAPTWQPYLNVTIMREPSAPTKPPARLGDRYGRDWGVDVPADGRGVWPLGQLMRDPSSFEAVMAFLYSPSLEAHPAGGFGAMLQPGETRRITEAVLFPFDAEADGTRTTLHLVPPALWAADGTPLPRSIVTFQVSGAVEAGRRVEPTDHELVAVDRPTLEAMAARDTAVWRRVFGLNWLAEQWPLESAEVLGQLASNAAEVSVVRNSALVNLGMNKAPAVVSIATAALLGSDQRGTRMSALTALGESGVPSAAGTVRPYILDAELGVSLRAIAAAGALKDADALPVLRQVLTDSSKRNRVDEVSAALASIGTPDAVVALLDLVRDRKTHDDVRIAVVRASAASRLIGVLPAVADVATDESDNKRVRTAAVRALADFGGGEALAGLRASLMSRESDVREAAVSSLVRTRDAAAVSEVIALVERSGSPLRETAIDSLATAGIRDSLPAIRRTAALQTNPVGIRRAAIRALGRLKDADAVPVLTSAANDSDRDTYQAVLTALAEIGADSMRPALTTALRSTHWQVRSQAARAIAERKFPETPALWQALLVERNDGAGSSIVTALIALGFAEPVAAPLVAGLDPAKNPLWFEHVRLLRHLTGQSIGPASESTGRQERTVELGRWRTWCASAPECR